MYKAVEAGPVTGKPVIFALQHVTIVTGPKPQRHCLTGGSDEAGRHPGDLRPQVPCGAAAQKVQDAAGLEASAGQ